MNGYSYSFHRFGEGPEGADRPTFEAMIDRCAELGLDGIELLGVHFTSTAPEDLHTIKQHAARDGVAIVAVSAHHNFVTPDPKERQRQLDVVATWVDVAATLGAPFVRVFGGRWQTRRSFAELMAARGEEPPREGYTDDDGYAWTAEAFRAACFYARRRGVTLALENHWGFTGTAAGVRRILRDVDSRWLGVVLDTGNFNFRPDPYAELAELAPHTVLVHAKTYVGGGIYYTADLDYRRVGQILRQAGYRGYVSLEFEGRAHPNEGIAESVRLLRDTLAGVS